MDPSDKTSGPAKPKAKRAKPPAQNAGKSLHDMGLETFDVIEIHRSDF